MNWYLYIFLLFSLLYFNYFFECLIGTKLLTKTRVLWLYIQSQAQLGPPEAWPSSPVFSGTRFSKRIKYRGALKFLEGFGFSSIFILHRNQNLEFTKQSPQLSLSQRNGKLQYGILFLICLLEVENISSSSSFLFSLDYFKEKPPRNMLVLV